VSERDPLFDGSAAGDDPALAALEQQLGAFAHKAPLREPPPRPQPRVRSRWILPGTALGLTAVAALIFWLGREKPQTVDCTSGNAGGFNFALTTGSATCGGTAIANAGTLPVGAWLETHRDGAATVQVADIGELTVFGDSKLRLVNTGATQHHLELERGHISAHVTAPPRLFVIDTPATSAVDLGCAYDLTVGPTGTTHLRVTKGAVSLEDKRGITYVPNTFEVDVIPGHFATPVFVNASAEMRAAIAEFDAGKPGALAKLIALADSGDRVTLWNIINHTHDPAAIAKLEQLAPLPDPSLHAKVLVGDADAMDIWLDVFVERGDLAHDKRKK
jgi:hypothetical protein